ncbi:hypothetical protein ABZ958_05265 [Streptomyces sp. NPDC046237]|uniref:hypothetical protein n=1 Tax=Streptomyces sp. NPDC046237 TaxID=3154914 RepID=UPI0033E5ABAC
MNVRRALVATALLLPVLAGCNGKTSVASAPDPSASSVPAAPAPPATVSASASASPSVGASSTATRTASPSATASPTTATTPSRRSPKPPVPTHLGLSVSAKGGALRLVRGGAAQEFTVTLRNGNTHAYRHLLLAFQMELLFGEPGDTAATGPDFVLERRDPVTGVWRQVALRMANDAMYYPGLKGGTPLARDAVRTERYRLSAPAAGPTGSTPVMVELIDTDTDARVAYHYLPMTAARR